MQSFIIPIYNVFVDVHEILITRLKKNISRVLFYVKKKMDLEQRCLVLVPRPSDDWEDPIPQEKGSPEININTMYIVKFSKTTIMVQTNLYNLF